MYAMDRAVHTEHSSEPRRTRREVWWFGRSTPTGSDPMPDDQDHRVDVAADFTD